MGSNLRLRISISGRWHVAAGDEGDEMMDVSFRHCRCFQAPAKIRNKNLAMRRTIFRSHRNRNSNFPPVWVFVNRFDF